MTLLSSLLLIVSPCVAVMQAPEEGPALIQIGHWVEFRGEFEGDIFVAERATIEEVDNDEELIGTVDPKLVDGDRFYLFGQEVHTSSKTEWEDVHPERLAGARIQLEGKYRGPRNFAARKISARGPGRERITGRVDSIELVEGGYHMKAMNFTIFVPHDVNFELDGPLATLGLSPVRYVPRLNDDREFDEDDIFGEGYQLIDGLWITGQLENKETYEDDFNINGTKDSNRFDIDFGARIRLSWLGTEGFTALGEVRVTQRFRYDTDDKDSDSRDVGIGEFYGLWNDVGRQGIDVMVGRQDFDDEREWIYDQNLDGVRVFIDRPSWDLEVAAATLLADGSDRDRDSTNTIAYLSNGDNDKHLAAWLFYRHVSGGGAETFYDPTRFVRDEDVVNAGIRAYGEWFEDHTSWLDIATIQGTRDETGPGSASETALHGWAFDIGTTWEPDFLDPFAFTLGYAWGSGDDDPGGKSDKTFRQTGFQDNNGKFAGVTSFRYYGELLDPELANLGIITAGVGARIADKTSLDLVAHMYRQVEPLDRLIDTNLRRRPDGLRRDIGWELDLILGSRRWDNWDLEIVAAYFDSGDAFSSGDDAFLGEFQLRYRF